MNATLGHADISRVLPRTLELCRAVSGLVAIVVLTGATAGLTLLGAQGWAENPPYIPEDSTSLPFVVTAAPDTEQTVFYLVETLEQVQLAEWGESFAARTGAKRSYRIIATESALAAAVYELARNASVHGAIQLQVIDLRDSI